MSMLVIIMLIAHFSCGLVVVMLENDCLEKENPFFAYCDYEVDIIYLLFLFLFGIPALLFTFFLIVAERGGLRGSNISLSFPNKNKRKLIQEESRKDLELNT